MLHLLKKIISSHGREYDFTRVCCAILVVPIWAILIPASGTLGCWLCCADRPGQSSPPSLVSAAHTSYVLIMQYLVLQYLLLEYLLLQSLHIPAMLVPVEITS